MVHSETRIAECEDRLRAGKRIDPGAPFVDVFLSDTLRRAGRFEEAFELTRINYAQDPYVPTKISNVLQAYEFGNQTEEAQELFAKAVRWWPEFKGNFLTNRATAKFARSDLDGLAELFRQEGKDATPPYAVGLVDLVDAARAKSLPGVRAVCGRDIPGFTAAFGAIMLAQLGDFDGAFAVTDRVYPRRLGSTPAETERIWLDQPEHLPTSLLSTPAAAALRRDPRFLTLAQRVGLIAYWQTGRLPDFCRKQREPICARLIRS